MGVDSANEAAATLEDVNLSEVLGTEDFVFVDELNAAIGEAIGPITVQEGYLDAWGG